MLLAISALSLAVTLALDVIRYWMLIVAAAVQAVGFAVYMPARAAFTAEAVPHAMLPNALALTQMSSSVAQIIGPAVAAGLIGIAAVGVTGAYFLTAGLALAGMLATVPLPRVDHRRGVPGDRCAESSVTA